MKRILFLFFASSALCSPAVAQHAQHYLQVQGDSAGASTRFVTDTGLVPTAHGLYGVVPLANGGTGPWLSGDVNRVLTSNGASAPSWQAGGAGGSDTSCVIYGGWNTAFNGGYVGLSFAYGSGGYPTFADSIVGNKAQPTLMNTAGKLSHLVIREAKTLDSTGCSCAGSDTFQLYKNGSPTAIQVIVPLGSRTGVDSVNSVTVAQGDLMQYHETSGSLGASPMAFSILNNISASNGTSPAIKTITTDTGTLTYGAGETKWYLEAPFGHTCSYVLVKPDSNSTLTGSTLIVLTKYGSIDTLTCSDGFNLAGNQIIIGASGSGKSGNSTELEILDGHFFTRNSNTFQP